MKVNLYKPALIAIIIVSIYSCNRNHLTSYSFKHWDLNKDGIVDKHEFHQSLMEKRMIRKWDKNKDGRLSELELYKGFYGLWDRNNNGKIDHKEWEYGTQNYFAVYNSIDHGTFEDWDQNGDAYLDEKEFQLSMTKADYFGAWNFNKKNSVNTEELSEKLFGLWDGNKDGHLEESEYDDVQESFLAK